MNVNEAIKIALNGEAILFLGAGFSIGGTNKMKKSIPTATELSLQMCKELHISESNNLPIVSDRFISDHNIGLGISRMIDFLKSRLICTQVSDEQLTIVKLPWIRIYTTNYDNIVEIASKVSKIYRESITATTEKPKIENLSGAIIHMNGSIQTVTEKNFFNDFKITNESYLRDGFLESPWGDLFVHDINNSKAIIFIGYSMRYDLDLQKVMHNKIRDKSIFIDRANLDENQEYLLNKWGTLEKIETTGFANKIISLQRTHIAKEKKQALQGVEEILITNYRNTSVSANDVLNMLIYGKYDKYSIRANTNFFIKREDYLERVKENIETHQICIIHSNFGNGKTVFLDYLASQLVEENNVYILNDAVHIQDDLRIISQSKSSSNLLLIDDYDMYMTVFKELSYGIPDNVKIIATCRSSISDILLDTLTNKYNISLNSIGIVNIEVLTDKDREYLVQLLNKYNFWGKYATYSHNNKKKLINHKYKNRMNCVLFMLLDSNVINDKIKIIMSDLN
ncbi:MAG: SIR2 family protein, partial [Selenomonadaceae bacterium]|nr:SIR2 family protein [Selenomonadaceae bacterium]